MKTASPALIDLLNGSNQFLMADLFTITLASGAVERYTTADSDITYGGNLFSSRGALLKRGTVRSVIGLEVDTLDMSVFSDASHLLDGKPFVSAAMSGSLDGANVLLERAFLSSWAAAPVGTVILFSGRVSDVSGSRTEVKIVVKSDIELLNIKLPRNLYQASCLNTVYDSSCAASKSAKTVAGIVTGGTTQSITSARSEAARWFEQGVLSFTSGANAGVFRTVKSYAGGAFGFALPLPNIPVSGDTFSVYPGCDKTQATCTSKFNNVIHFRGFPYVPVPETAT
jgi:uncharacterized phage protein (TIGR02218 family)